MLVNLLLARRCRRLAMRARLVSASFLGGHLLLSRARLAATAATMPKLLPGGWRGAPSLTTSRTGSLPHLG